MNPPHPPQTAKNSKLIWMEITMTTCMTVKIMW
jgi:hypothetical protein